jgi:hypothetical protein
MTHRVVRNCATGCGKPPAATGITPETAARRPAFPEARGIWPGGNATAAATDGRRKSRSEPSGGSGVSRARPIERPWLTRSPASVPTSSRVGGQGQDDKANLPRTPASVKATYSTTVTWKCPDPRHDAYRASPRARTKIPPDKPGCPDCRKMDQARPYGAHRIQTRTTTSSKRTEPCLTGRRMLARRTRRAARSPRMTSRRSPLRPATSAMPHSPLRCHFGVVSHSGRTRSAHQSGHRQTHP